MQWRRPVLSVVALSVLAWLGVACGPSPRSSGDGGPVSRDSSGQRDRPPAGKCTEGASRCSGSAWQVCESETWVKKRECIAPSVCADALGCVACVPGQLACGDDGNIYDCKTDGTLGTLKQQCTKENCRNGYCADPCAEAVAANSYIGCDYWPTVTVNPEVDTSFHFAAVVANTGTAAADVTVTGGGLSGPLSESVGPGQIKQILLPWVESLKQTSPAANPHGHERSVLARGGAYHLVSTSPVTVYQFNALEYQVGSDYSYTNDASLLLPSHVLKDRYLVMARATSTLVFSTMFGDEYSSVPGFFAVTAVKPGSTKVTVQATSGTLASQDGAVRAIAKGGQADFTLNQGDVLQIMSNIPQTCVPKVTEECQPGVECGYCDNSAGYDLTGSEISSDQAVAVIGGHAIAFVPFSVWAADHLEEQIFPLEAWGKDYLATNAKNPNNDPNVWRVLSGKDGNRIEFDPPAVHAAVTLNRGQWVEFESRQDFRAQGTEAFLLAGFMVGQNYSNRNPGQGAPGDPSMTLAVPSEQYRQSYVFLAPESYQQNYVNVTAPDGAEVRLDGSPIPAGQFTPIGSSGFGVAKVDISGGSHTIESSSQFGIAVYGVGSYTSYMYPGGLDLKSINPPG